MAERETRKAERVRNRIDQTESDPVRFDVPRRESAAPDSGQEIR